MTKEEPGASLQPNIRKVSIFTLSSPTFPRQARDPQDRDITNNFIRPIPCNNNHSLEKLGIPFSSHQANMRKVSVSTLSSPAFPRQARDPPNITHSALKQMCVTDFLLR